MITVVCGSMFAGKSEELIRRVRRSLYAGRKVQVFKPAIDNRYDDTRVCSHEGRSISATVVERASSISYQVDPDTRLIAVDEVQFFDQSIVDFAHLAIREDRDVLFAGLDTDFRGQPFGPMPELLALADEVVKLRAICVKCGELASHTFRMIDGQPAPFSGPTVMVGGLESYEARCHKCFYEAYA